MVPADPPRPPRDPRTARHRRPPRRRRLLVTILAVVVLLIVGVVAWYEIEAHPFGGPGRREVIEVVSGESNSQVASTLAAHGVIGSALAFRLNV